MQPRTTTVTILAFVSLLVVALGGALLRSPSTLPAGLLLLGIGSGIVLRTWLRGQK